MTIGTASRSGWGTCLRLAMGPGLGWLVSTLLPGQYMDAEGVSQALPAAGQMTILVMVWMAVWWLTEATAVSTTALLPLVLFPILGARTMEESASPYANPLIFLFLGGFLIAKAMQRWKLDQRLALLTLKSVGSKPSRLIGGFMLITAVLSAFVSNTATTAMMLPIGLSLISLLDNQPGDQQEGRQAFARCLMLGIAYSATLGGIATIIGTPPNAFLVGFLADKMDPQYRMQLSFVRWLAIGIPLTAVMLPLTWFLLTRVLFPIRLQEIQGGRALISEQLRQLGTLSRGEIATLAVFLLTAVAWVIRPLLVKIRLGDEYLLSGLTDAGIAMTASLALFLIPVNLRRQEFVMDWKAARAVPWDILLLFGGGMSLAQAVKGTGVAEFLGAQAVRFEGIPTLLLVVIVTAAVIFLTELTSNIATTATLLPVLAALAPGLGVHPYQLIFPAALSASFAFMMPVATPPNAIVFGSGAIELKEMMRAGWWLNLLGIVAVVAVTHWVLPWVIPLSE